MPRVPATAELPVLAHSRALVTVEPWSALQRVVADGHAPCSAGQRLQARYPDKVLAQLCLALAATERAELPLGVPSSTKLRTDVALWLGQTDRLPESGERLCLLVA